MKSRETLEREIKILKSDNEIFKKVIRMNGWTIDKQSDKCSCTPTKYYHIPEDMRDFAPKPDKGCYTCNKCGRPQFCEHCIKNYNMTLNVVSKKSLKIFNK